MDFLTPFVGLDADMEVDLGLFVLPFGRPFFAPVMGVEMVEGRGGLKGLGGIVVVDCFV